MLNRTKNNNQYDKYKDSGIEWIGEIPKGWHVRKLFGLLNAIGSGTTPKGNDNYYNGQIYWLNTGDLNDSFIYDTSKTITDLAIKEYSTLKVFNEGSIVIAMYGATIGKLGILKIPTTTNQACCVMSCNPLLNNKYLFYSLYSARDYILTLSYGSGQPNISQETMKSFKLCNPPINEQQQIADYLDKKCGEIDRVVETQKDIIEKLKEYKQSVITEAVTKGLDKSAPLKDSGIEWIGKIPEHWENIKLKFCTYIRARLGWKGLKAEEYVEEGYPLLSAFNIVNGKLLFEDLNFINQFRYDESPEIKLQENDILLVKDGAGIGKCAIVENMPIPSTANGSLAVITTNRNLVAKFLYYYFLSMLFQAYIDRLKDGMGVPHLFQADLKEINIVIPHTNEQQEIAEYLDKKCSEIDSVISDKEQLIEKLTEYKKSLIYECVTGKRKVVA